MPGGALSNTRLLVTAGSVYLVVLVLVLVTVICWAKWPAIGTSLLAGGFISLAVIAPWSLGAALAIGPADDPPVYSGSPLALARWALSAPAGHPGELCVVAVAPTVLLAVLAGWRTRGRP